MGVREQQHVGKKTEAGTCGGSAVKAAIVFAKLLLNQKYGWRRERQESTMDSVPKPGSGRIGEAGGND